MDMPFHVGRLAPSPTGAQHVGNARTYLIAWLSARSKGRQAHGQRSVGEPAANTTHSQSSRILLRIEDIDSPRIKAGATELLSVDLQWLGLDWDAGPFVQTERLPLYENVLAELKARDLVYPCTCTRTDIERAASAPHLEHEGPAYPGTCSKRRAADAESLDVPFAWRVRTGHRQFAWEDGFRGPMSLGMDDVGGDFVVWKSQGTPAYQLAVVVDDAEMGVTEVVRGDDLIPSTPRQLLLYDMLGLKPPQFIHVPLVVGPDGRRLAKRHGDTRLITLREQGVRPEMLVGYLAWSCGWLSRPEPISARELLSVFVLEKIPRQPLVFDGVLTFAR